MPPSTENRTSDMDERQARAELRDSLPGVALILGGVAILGLVDPEGVSPWNLVWALVALGSVGWFVWVEARNLRRADEYQRIMRLEALAVGFATVMVLSFAGGLLDELGIVDARECLSVTVPAGVVAWVTALGIKTKRAH